MRKNWIKLKGCSFVDQQVVEINEIGVLSSPILLRIMIVISVILSMLILFGCSSSKNVKQEIYSDDINLFWNAYDKIVSTKDSVLQLKYINELFINKGSKGLKNIMLVKNYTDQQYVKAINNYPEFWNSIRANTLLSKNYDEKISVSIQKLSTIYPDLKPVSIYFTIGVFRTGGTIYDKTVLIGSELSFADKTTKIEELPEWRKPFFKENEPLRDLELLCLHEYVHTQQTELVDNLLSYCLYEGVAEFVSTLALGLPSSKPGVHFGQANEALVKQKFQEDVFVAKNTYNWLWGENHNELKVRDLGYYIGYSICESYYKQANDKKKAIKEMIELDYHNEKQIEAFVDSSHFFTKSVAKLYQNYDNARPTIVRIEPDINNQKAVSAATKTITIYFSSPMDKETRGFDFGPKGEKNVLKVHNIIGFSEDGMSSTFEVELKPNTDYQSLISNRFLDENGFELKPFLLDFRTGN